MHVFDSEGVPIAYVNLPATAGAGDPILLIHGFASNHAVNWVNTLWTKTLTHAGFRVIALDNRGHGASGKPTDPAAYAPEIMAEDARRLLDHLGLRRADVMGYSMGARIGAHLAIRHPQRVRSLLLGGLGIHLVDGQGLPSGIDAAMEAASLQDLTDPTQRMFRAFAEATGSDLAALAACIRGSRLSMTREEVASLVVPTLISVGTRDDIAGSPHDLARLMPNAIAIDIPGKDHNLAVGDRGHKEAVLDFLRWRP